jgi:hypothetical protein
MKKLLYCSIIIISASFNSQIISQSFASMHIATPSTQNGINGWTTVTGFTQGDKSSDWSLSSDELTKSSGSSTALYFISFSLSFSGSNTGDWEIGISVNSGNPGSISTIRYLANNDVGDVSASGYLTLNPDDIVSLKVNPPSSANIDKSYASVTVVRVEDLSAYNSYAEMGFYNNTSTISIGTSFTDLINAGYTSSNLQNWSQASGVLTAGAGADGTYLVSSSFNFNGSANTEYTIGVSKNNSDPIKSVGGRKIGNNNDIGDVTIWGILTIVQGDNIKLKVKADGNNKDLTVEYCHISLCKISSGIRDTDPFPYASMNISTSSPSPISLTASTDNQLTDYLDDITDNSYWSFSNSQFSPIGISAGYYRVNYFISYSTSSGVDVTFKVLNNGSEITQLTSRRSTSNTDKGSVAGNGIILIENASDQLTIVVNPASGVDINLYQSRLSLSRLEKTSDISFPVELSSFSAAISENGIKLKWGTETEVNNYGFEVQRSMSNVQSKSWQLLGFVDGHGNSNSPKDYSFVDENVTAGKHSYRLKQIDTDGQFEYSKIIEIDLGSVINYELSQNYPNPFNPSTTIRYSISENSFINLSVYNSLGEKIEELVNEVKEPGVYTVEFKAESVTGKLSSGTYIYRLQANDFTQIKKMILVK